MPADWQFEHSIVTTACPREAWAFMTNLENLADMEPAVERFELDGPFATGTRGRTIAEGFQQEWELSGVVSEESYVITGAEPDFVLSFLWSFEDHGEGSRLTRDTDEGQCSRRQGDASIRRTRSSKN
jgi:hypothetical protein